MTLVNFEFKASCSNIEQCERRLKVFNPHYVGEDRQSDTYFNIPDGRLKLREGNIENALIYYKRADLADAKKSDVILYHSAEPSILKCLLEAAHGIKVVVNKIRRIYFIDNVKFHFDIVDQLGSFVEVEAIDQDGTRGMETLLQQCDAYAKILQLKKEDFESRSYSDLLLSCK